MTLSEVKNYIRDHLSIECKYLGKDLNVCLKYCKDKNPDTGDLYYIDTLTLRIVHDLVDDIKHREKGLEELLEVLYYVSGNNRRYYRHKALRASEDT